MPKQTLIDDGRVYYYVRIKYTVWPEIYGEQLPIPFPTLNAALLFAENNVSVNKPLTRVYMPNGNLVETFKYGREHNVRGKSRLQRQ